MPSEHIVTRAVRLLSDAHSTTDMVRRGKMSISDLSRRTILSKQHFPKFLGFSMICSGLVGFFSMNYVQRRQLKNQQDREAEHSLIRLRQGSVVGGVGSMSHNEATVRAMIENARSSSWKENLNNAMDAHDRFMLGSQNKNEPEFVERIRKRSEEIVKDSDQGGGNR